MREQARGKSKPSKSRRASSLVRRMPPTALHDGMQECRRADVVRRLTLKAPMRAAVLASPTALNSSASGSSTARAAAATAVRRRCRVASRASHAA